MGTGRVAAWRTEDTERGSVLLVLRATGEAGLWAGVGHKHWDNTQEFEGRRESCWVLSKGHVGTDLSAQGTGPRSVPWAAAFTFASDSAVRCWVWATEE